MHYDIMINGLPVAATYSDENSNTIFLPLLRHLTKLQQDKKARILVMLAAPPGAGKSTLASFLQHLASITDGLSPITVIGMDGFHRYQDYLLSHTLIRDGVEIPMVKVKGTPETFDLPLLLKAVQSVANGENCGWPEYDRLKHNPQENAITVSGDIVLLEGNYLLLQEDGWDRLSDFADYTIKITADESILRTRLIDRKLACGNSYEDSVSFVDYSDMYNVKICLERSAKANLELLLNADNSYQKI